MNEFNLMLTPDRVDGLDDAEAIQKLRELIDVYYYHAAKNEEKERYYEGNIPLSEVNLGIALPKGFKDLDIGCAWGAKTVDVLASRSMFDGFVSGTGDEAEIMSNIIMSNRLVYEYKKACRDELKFGCTFATLSKDKKAGCKIRFHSPQSAAALWNGEKNRIDCGFAIIDSVKDEGDSKYVPSLVNLYTDTDIWILRRNHYMWTAERKPHIMGRPMMEPLVWNPTSGKPFGQSRLKDSIRKLIQSYVRTIANATIGLEFSTAPQKYLLGITDEQYDELINKKFKSYIGSLMTATTNPETGQNPDFGQLAQGNIQPHVEMMRMIATQFSAATGLTVTDVGVVNDANPTSSDAIIAQSQTLIQYAEDLNQGNAGALYTIAQMAQAIENDCKIEDLNDDQRNIIAHFKNPAMPSVAVTADAAIKIASARQGFGQTDAFLEMIGFSQADIRRIKAQERDVRGQLLLQAEFKNLNADQSTQSTVANGGENTDGNQ